jgi:CSLREA domain-containing protein
MEFTQGGKMHLRKGILSGLLLIIAAAVTACGKSTIVYGGGPPAVSFTVNSANDADDGTCNATHCSLREAINAANAAPGFNGVYFNIPGAGIHRIETATGFPEISDPIVIDGTTQPGFSGMPLIELRSSVDQNGTALSVHGGNSTIQSLSIINFNIGVEIKDQGTVWIVGNYIGVRADGTAAVGNHTGVKVYSGDNHIGGTPLAYRNVISGNTAGVDVQCESEGNLIQNNYIGLNAAGTSALANATFGIHVCGSNNTIGGDDPLARNVISGNAGNGVEIQGMLGAPYPATGNQINRNLIGTDPTGMSALGNGQNGVLVAADGTILSGNTISGNMLNGVLVEAHQETLITGNFIGVNSSGSHYINNVGCGVLLHNASNNWIGGGDAGAGNVISGNMNAGIKIDADPGAVATANGIQGNKIGTNAGGTAEIANQTGIYITGNGNTVGGPALGARNLISGNYGDGLRIKGSLNVVQLNYIGTDISGKNPLGNQFNGVRLEAGAAQNSIGTEGAGNTIAFNGGPGVVLYDDAGTGNLIQTNSIHDNAGLGIQFGTSGIPLANDPGDTDTGPNTLINHPTMISAISQFNSQFRASLNAAPGTAYRVDFYTNAACDPSGFGEGHRHVKSVTVMTDITGLGMAVADFPSTYFDTGNYVTATATDPNGNTSEFSNCIQVVEATPTPNKAATLTPTLAKAFFTVKLSADHVYYRGTGCGDSFVKWNVQVAEPNKVAGIWLFVRLRNKDGEGITTWGDAIVMAPGGSGWYMYQLETTDIPGFVKWENSWIQYQLVAYDKGFARVATSEVYSDLLLSACHTNG